MRTGRHVFELLPLPTAAVLAYREVMGRPLEVTDMAQTHAILGDVANALSNVAAIYSTDNPGAPRQIEPVDLIYGAFQRGAAVLRTPRGEHTKLAIRRVDLQDATRAFINAGVRFPGPAEKEA